MEIRALSLITWLASSGLELQHRFEKRPSDRFVISVKSHRYRAFGVTSDMLKAAGGPGAVVLTRVRPDVCFAKGNICDVRLGQ
jgi:hypothetical protein